jgi:hypothetical protein
MGMSERARQLLQNLLYLPADDRRAVMEELWGSLQLETEEPRLLYEREWTEEIKRRIESDDPGIPGEQVLAEARARVRAQRAQPKAK